MKVLKTFRDSPFSRVVLVREGAEKVICKSVPVRSCAEFYRQRVLARACKTVKVPKVYSIKMNGLTAFARMEYIPHRKPLLLDEVLYVLSVFHHETASVRSSHFPRYDFKRFYEEFSLVKDHLPRDLRVMSRSSLKEFLLEVFSSPKAVLHGDFHAGQVLRARNGYYLIDFVSSMIGPRILDYAYLWRKKKRLGTRLFPFVACRGESEAAVRTRLYKALVVIMVFDIHWLAKHHAESVELRKASDNLARVLSALQPKAS